MGGWAQVHGSVNAFAHTHKTGRRQRAGEASVLQPAGPVAAQQTAALSLPATHACTSCPRWSSQPHLRLVVRLLHLFPHLRRHLQLAARRQQALGGLHQESNEKGLGRGGGESQTSRKMAPHSPPTYSTCRWLGVGRNVQATPTPLGVPLGLHPSPLAFAVSSTSRRGMWARQWMAAHSLMMVDMLLSFRTYHWLPALASEWRMDRALQAQDVCVWVEGGSAGNGRAHA